MLSWRVRWESFFKMPERRVIEAVINWSWRDEFKPEQQKKKKMEAGGWWLGWLSFYSCCCQKNSLHPDALYVLKTSPPPPLKYTRAALLGVTLTRSAEITDSHINKQQLPETKTQLQIFSSGTTLSGSSDGKENCLASNIHALTQIPHTASSPRVAIRRFQTKRQSPGNV